MELFRVIKRDARLGLRFFWGRLTGTVIVITLAYLAISLAESVLIFIFSGLEGLNSDMLNLESRNPATEFISLGTSLLYLLIMPALTIGQKKLCLAFANGEDESLALVFDVFSSFKKFFGAAVFALMGAVRYAAVFAAAAVPGISLILFAYAYMPEGTPTLEILKIAVYCIGFSLVILCFSLGIIFSQRWSLASYYKAAGAGVHKSFALSVKATRGRCTEIIGFKLSFFGWGLLSLLLLPILYAVPYYSLASAIYAKYLMEKYEKSLAQVPKEVDPNPLQFDIED